MTIPTVPLTATADLIWSTYEDNGNRAGMIKCADAPPVSPDNTAFLPAVYTLLL